MRGSLIFPFVVRLGQLDTVAMAADPDGAGPETSGYDLDFREPIGVAADADDRIGTTLRRETFVEVHAQIEPGAFEAMQQVLGGTQPDTLIQLVFHFKELEDMGMVDKDGVATIRLNDRLDRIIDGCGNDVQVFRNPPGLFVTQVLPGGYGLGPRRNLLFVTFEERETGARAASAR